MVAKIKNKIAENTKSTEKSCIMQLENLRPYITSDDRRKAMAEYSISYGTVGRYLTGKVPNLTLGTNLLNFFVQQLKKRETIVKQSKTAVNPLVKKLNNSQ